MPKAITYQSASLSEGLTPTPRDEHVSDSVGSCNTVHAHIHTAAKMLVVNIYCHGEDI
jgi:hypothetical protein